MIEGARVGPNPPGSRKPYHGNREGRKNPTANIATAAGSDNKVLD